MAYRNEVLLKDDSGSVVIVNKQNLPEELLNAWDPKYKLYAVPTNGECDFVYVNMYTKQWYSMFDKLQYLYYDGASIDTGLSHIIGPVYKANTYLVCSNFNKVQETAVNVNGSKGLYYFADGDELNEIVFVYIVKETGTASSLGATSSNFANDSAVKYIIRETRYKTDNTDYTFSFSDGLGEEEFDTHVTVTTQDLFALIGSTSGEWCEKINSSNNMCISIPNSKVYNTLVCKNSSGETITHVQNMNQNYIIDEYVACSPDNFK